MHLFILFVLFSYINYKHLPIDSILYFWPITNIKILCILLKIQLHLWMLEKISRVLTDEKDLIYLGNLTLKTHERARTNTRTGHIFTRAFTRPFSRKESHTHRWKLWKKLYSYSSIVFIVYLKRHVTWTQKINFKKNQKLVTEFKKIKSLKAFKNNDHDNNK